VLFTDHTATISSSHPAEQALHATTALQFRERRFINDVRAIVERSDDEGPYGGRSHLAAYSLGCELSNFAPPRLRAKRTNFCVQPNKSYTQNHAGSNPAEGVTALIA